MQPEILDAYLEQGYLMRQTHPNYEGELFIYNYTPKTTFEAHWDEITESCRGLIVTRDGTIVARPLRKFFNYEELPRLGRTMPNHRFTVHEKFDGSLIIVTKFEGHVLVASRGSFTSMQAQEANLMLLEKYGTEWVEDGWTYCFELIIPENRIVVDYGQHRGLVLLAKIDTSSGLEIPVQHVTEWQHDRALPLATHTNYGQEFDHVAAHLKTKNLFNEEGYVIRFITGERVKIKFEEYVRLHRIVTGLNERVIWEYLSEGKNLDELMEGVPEEFEQWIKSTSSALLDEYRQTELDALVEFHRATAPLKVGRSQTRKQFADSVKDLPPHLRTACFLHYDNKPYDQVIWKHIRPSPAQALVPILFGVA